MVTENTTPNRGYQEPAVGNTLEVDVGRLIAALRAIDTDVASALAAIVAKAGLNSPAFTGTPTAPTAAPGTDSGQLATTAFVKAALAALVGLAPEALDTIEELAAASESNSDLIDLLEAAVALKADAATTTAALVGKEDLLSAATSDSTFDDTDEVVYLTGTTRKRGALAGLITSIFKTTRTIANGQFAAATFKLFNGAGTPRALSIDATAMTANRKITMPDADVVLGNSAFTKEYVSSELSLTSGGTATLAHGLGVVPKLVEIMLVCKTAEGGYNVGDVLYWGNGFAYYGASQGSGCSIVVDATNLNVKYSNYTSVFVVLNRSTGGYLTITNANWRAVFKAWA
ncbi:hypothetical protein [Shinella zoogloeoides]|uniref:hypothetical protein n=1 Tax=Shinella zoogloeoides TaxID=352475 RepID=UPI0028B126A3|nr:hypothetical protein [Shinella zoogloeoides]